MPLRPRFHNQFRRLTVSRHIIFFSEVFDMTSMQKTAAQEMRLLGYGYKKIANELALPVSTIQSFCRRNHLPKVGVLIDQGTHCRLCGAELTQTPRTKKNTFCSAECRTRWWSKNRNRVDNPRLIERRCAQCGRLFRSCASANRKYCGHACYVLARFGKEERDDARAI